MTRPYSRSETDGPDEVDATAGLTDIERARVYFGNRLKEDARLGYKLDGLWVRSTEVVDLFFRETRAAPRRRSAKPRAEQRQPTLNVQVLVAVTDDIRMRLINKGLVSKTRSEDPDILRSVFAKIIRDRLFG